VFLLRAAGPDDLEAICELARHLDSPNLPRDEAFLRRRLERSARAFASPDRPAAEREYQFALVDAEDRVVGTAVILSKHGTPDAPHLYLDVTTEERYSRTAELMIRHVLLQRGATWDGPSELGALVLSPELRGAPGSPGKLLSWGRFAYIARHRAAFERELLAEMRAAIDGTGDNAFWNVFGKRFTGMSYAEADRRSATDKDFILDLFPRREFYASLLDEQVAAQIGEVHAETIPALRLLEKAGLHWIGQIDPFDAGPFVGGAVDEVLPVRETWTGVVAEGEPGSAASASIVASEDGRHFRAVVASASIDDSSLRLAKEARDRLDLTPGDAVSVTPMPVRSRRPDSV
jgi:arginine N-succinyltransferase